MYFFVNTDFRGRWPVGTAAVVAAESAERAARLLEAELAKRGLPQPVKANDMHLIMLDQESVEILCDGDY